MTTERPKWVRRLSAFLADEVMDPSYPEDGSGDELLDRIESAVNDILCAEFGHEIVDDQCGLPAHRYCVWCGRRESTFEQVTS